MNRVDDTSDACARSPARDPFTGRRPMPSPPAPGSADPRTPPPRTPAAPSRTAPPSATACRSAPRAQSPAARRGAAIAGRSARQSRSPRPADRRWTHRHGWSAAGSPRARYRAIGSQAQRAQHVALRVQQVAAFRRRHSPVMLLSVALIAIGTRIRRIAVRLAQRRVQPSRIIARSLSRRARQAAAE